MNRKNIIIILSDALRADHLGCYGYEKNISPNIDSLASQGSLFENAFTVAPITNVSIASLLTGCYPKTHGVRSPISFLRKGSSTMVQYFKDNGYQTGGIVSCATIDKAKGFSQGFDYYNDNFANTQSEQNITTENAILRDSKTAIQLAEEWIAGLDSNLPFFLFIHLYDTHSPYRPNEDYCNDFPNSYNGSIKGSDEEGKEINLGKLALNRDDVNYLNYLYDGEIYRTDKNIGRFVDYLNQNNIYENSLICLTSDHGVNLYDKGLWGSGRRLYDNEIHIPLIITGCFDYKKKRVSSLISNIDVFPTIIDYLDLEFPSQIDGKSSMQGFKEENEPSNHIIYAETYMADDVINKRVCVRNQKWKLIHPIIDPLTPVSEKDKFVGIFKRIRSLINRLNANKSMQKRLIKRALDIVFFNKEGKYSTLLDQRDKKLLTEEFELYNIKNDPNEVQNLSSNEEFIFSLLKNELVFLSNTFILNQKGIQELSGKELDEANNVLRKLGYK